MLRDRQRIRLLEQNGYFMLCSAWLIGLIAGSCFLGASVNIHSLMGAAVQLRVSIVSLLAVTLFPMLLSAIAVMICLPRLILPIAFLEAALLGCFIRGCVLAFRDAYWLIGTMLSFSGFLMRIPLMCFWLRCVSGHLRHLSRDLMQACILAVIFCLLDGCVIAPFLTSLY